MHARGLTIAMLLVSVVLAGCADEAPRTDDGEPGLEVTDNTGGIRGVVVDQSITPIAEAKVKLLNSETEFVTGEDGTFTFTGLSPGVYFLEASKPGYQGAQTSTQVEAGVERPPSVTIQLIRIAGADPYEETLQFDGFYECAFALWFITDSCDFVVRTVHDAGVTAVPRGIQNNINTDYVYMTKDVDSIVQEGFFDTGDVPNFRFSIADTPIDNACDCSPVFLETISDTGYGYGRLDRGGAFPHDEKDFAVRGFIPFQEGLTDVAYGTNIDFQVFTTLFYHYQPEEGWDFQEAAGYT